jgi:nucleotide-binding universal stress UspA family protein
MAQGAAVFRRILAPVDLSPASRRPLEYALALGTLFGSVVDALHVWRTNTQTPVTAARDHAKQELRTFVGELLIPAGVELRRRTDYGDPYLTILRVAQLSGYDLIVALAPEVGRARPEHVSLALLQTSPVPVLLVPRGWAPGAADLDLRGSLRRVLVPAAMAGRSQRALESALALCAASGATLELLLTAGTSADDRLALEHAAALGANAERCEAPGELDEALRERAKVGGYELCVLGVDGTALGASTRDERAERALALQQCPVLCVHH